MPVAAPIQPLSPGPQIIDLHQISAADLSPLLLEETAEWDQRFLWDFSRSADLVRRFAGMKALDGAVLSDRGELAGYGYSVLEDYKGLIGDIFVRPAWRDGHTEVRLFRHLLDRLIDVPAVRRIESQLMTTDETVGRAIQRERFVRIFERRLMILDVGENREPKQRALGRDYRIDAWSDMNLDAVAGIIALAYGSHIDAQINDQYRSVAGARRFLSNIVQFPGCGSFFRPASFIGVDLVTGWASGAVLSSFVADGVGHITQLCVAPKTRGSGLGSELLRRAIIELVAHGAKRISLTVTVENTEAIGLYERFGFADSTHVPRVCLGDEIEEGAVAAPVLSSRQSAARRGGPEHMSGATENVMVRSRTDRRCNRAAHPCRNRPVRR